MRILSVGNMYPPHHQGGYELIWSSWVDYARQRGHRVRVLTTDFRTEVDPGPARDDQAEVHRTLRWYWRDHEFPRLSLAERWAIERHNASVLDAQVTEFRPDVVSWWAMGGMSLSLLGRASRRELPAVGMICDDWLLYGPTVDAWTRAFSDRPRLAEAVERMTGAVTRAEVGRVLGWVFLSETLRARALDAWPALVGAEVAHRGADEEFRETPSGPWQWNLLYVGRIDSRKGIDLAVLALARLPDQASLTVIGSGDEAYAAELRQLVSELGLDDRVRFERLARDELVRAYENCDAVLFPVRWAEPWGLVPLEAMAVGRPVLATGRGGSGEYLSDRENCLLFDPDAGAEALARLVTDLASDPQLRERLRSGGLRTAGSISAERYNARVTAAVERAAEPSRRASAGARLGA
jgi:glycogen(starch) synthase